MKYSQIMVRYGELSTKGKNRKYFVNHLRDNIKSSMSDLEGIEVEADYDRTYITLNGHDGTDVMARLKNIFGIQSFSPIVQTEKTLEAASKAAIELVGSKYTGKETFKIAAKRADHSFEYNTMDLNRLIGAAVIDAYPEIEAQMKKPDITINVDVRQQGINLSTEIIQGPGGFPVGTGGKAMLMLSGGIDSPVAGYLTMKKGIEVEAVHFFSPPYTSPQALQKAKELTVKIAQYSGKIRFIEVPFTEIQETIKKELPDPYSMTINRRFMMRITDAIREKRRGLAIVNGESVGQVASQTLESMFAINAVTSTPILRPLVSMDKNEIIDIAKEIDTFDLSVQPYEDCCTVFAPVKPKTRPRLDQVEKLEQKLDVEGLIQRAVDGIKIVEITPSTSLQEEVDDLLSGLL